MSDGLMGLVIGFILGAFTVAIVMCAYMGFAPWDDVPDEPIEYDEIN